MDPERSNQMTVAAGCVVVGDRLVMSESGDLRVTNVGRFWDHQHQQRVRIETGRYRGTDLPPGAPYEGGSFTLRPFDAVVVIREESSSQ